MIPSPWPLAPQPVPEQALLDIPVVQAVLPMPKIVIAEGVPEEADHPLLRTGLALADRRHALASSGFRIAAATAKAGTARA